MQTKNGWVKVKILTPKDFDGYDYNKPGDKWELVEMLDGLRIWTPKNQLRKRK